MSATIAIMIPFDLRPDELVPDPNAREDLGDCLAWLSLNVTDDEECERIFRSAVVLFHAQRGRATFAECIGSAMIWERG